MGSVGPVEQGTVGGGLGELSGICGIFGAGDGGMVQGVPHNSNGIRGTSVS